MSGILLRRRCGARRLRARGGQANRGHQGTTILPILCIPLLVPIVANLCILFVRPVAPIVPILCILFVVPFPFIP